MSTSLDMSRKGNDHAAARTDRVTRELRRDCTRPALPAHSTTFAHASIYGGNIMHEIAIIRNSSVLHYLYISATMQSRKSPRA